MRVQSPEIANPSTGISDLLAISFGTTVAMWAVGYVGHMPLTDISPAVFVSLMLVCLVIGGGVAGRYTPRGVRGGMWVGLISALLNLLILGSILARPNTSQIVPQAALWVPGWFLLSMALAGMGAWIGGRGRTWGVGRGACQENPTIPLDSSVPTAYAPRPTVPWLAAFAWVTSAAALLLIAIGGLVTGFRAGMAVDNWPNTFEYNMFLYPLAKMTGGVFYEHAHRLLGSLVGFATLTMAIYVTARKVGQGRADAGGTSQTGLLSISALRDTSERSATDVPPGCRVACPTLPGQLVTFVWIIGSCVAIQGVMGGLRVTRDSHVLAVIHGFFAHAILGALVAVAVILSRRFSPLRSGEGTGGWADRFLSVLLVCFVLLQTLLGTLVRQVDLSLISHISFAAIVALVALGAGMRAWGLHSSSAWLRRSGIALMLLVVLQISLGIVSLIYRTPSVGASPTAEQLATQALGLQPATAALLTTAHQTTAALILSVAVVLAVSTGRRDEEISFADE